MINLTTPSPFPAANLPGEGFNPKLSSPYGSRELCGDHILHWIHVGQLEAQLPDAAAHLANAIEHVERFHGIGDKTTVEVKVVDDLPMVWQCVQDAVTELNGYGVKIVVSSPSGLCSLDVPTPIAAGLLQAIRDAASHGQFVHPVSKDLVYMK